MPESGHDPLLTERQRDAMRLLLADHEAEGGPYGGCLTVDPSGPCTDWNWEGPTCPWINYRTGRALQRRGLASIEERSPLDGPDVIKLTSDGVTVALAISLHDIAREAQDGGEAS